MNTRVLKITASIGIVFVCAGVFAYRRPLAERWAIMTTPELPAPVAFEDIDEEPVLPEAEPVQPAPVVEEPVVSAPEPVQEPVTPTEEPVVPPSQPPEAPGSTMPAQFNLAVPFTSQAPFANWDEVHEETCEEAVVYMVHAYYEGVRSATLNPETADAELLKLVDLQKTMFGYFEDTTVEETAAFAKRAYGLQARILKNPTIEELKQELVAGRPVIIPAAGRELHNPNFTGAGPVYHMVVLRGYTPTQFITNDSGTRKGAQYLYDYDIIMNAMHDWNADDISKGAKIALVLEPA